MPSSQFGPSQSQSSYIPSSQSSKCEDSEVFDDSVIDGDHNKEKNKYYILLFLETEDLSGAIVLVMWLNLLQLLTKCRKPGCGAAVLPDNINPVRNGTLN